jgi:hypothetical protein
LPGHILALQQKAGVNFKISYEPDSICLSPSYLSMLLRGGELIDRGDLTAEPRTKEAEETDGLLIL